MGDAAGKLAHRLQLLRLPQCFLRQRQLNRTFFDTLLQRLVQLVDVRFGAVGFSDVVPLKENASDLARLVADRLVDEVQDDVAAWLVGCVAQCYCKALGDETLACRVYAVQHFIQALAFNFRKDLPDRAAKGVSPSHKLNICVVYELKNVFGTSQYGNEARRLLEKLLLTFGLVFEPALGQHRVGRFRSGAENASHYTILIAHGRIGESEPAVFGIAIALEHKVKVL